MNFDQRKLFVVIGYPHAGKTRTLQLLFNRRNFFPFKQPITAVRLGNSKFIVIKISDYNLRTADYLARIKAVLIRHIATNTSFMITISLIFDDSSSDVKMALNFFNGSGFDIHYLVLCSSINEKKVISEEDIAKLYQFVNKGNIHLFDKLVTQSSLRFKERTEEVKDKIVACLEPKKWG